MSKNTSGQSMDPIFKVEGKVIALTGGLGMIGSAIVHSLTERGAKVAVLDKNADTHLPDIDGLSKDNFFWISCDIRQRAGIETAAKQIAQKWETPHGLINNSPVDLPSASHDSFETTKSETFDHSLAISLKGLTQCCQVIGGQMAQAGRGSIINLVSVYGMVSPDQRIFEPRRKTDEPSFKSAADTTAQAAVINLTKYLATYWAERNLRVNSLSLGSILNHQEEFMAQSYCSRVPLGRMARQDEFNGAVIFLLSSASSYMTGANLVLDGGWTAW